jgi:4'-phosphopantetheinyl transferase
VTTPDDNEVAIWFVRLDRRAQPVERLRRLLSPDEQDRLERFRFRHDAIRFVTLRAVLRAVLAERLGASPEEIRFAYGPYGKPELAMPFNRRGVAFSVSHSADLGVVAVTAGRRVGVDIERVRPLPDLEAMSEQVFSPREQGALRTIPPVLRPRAFLNGWTRKEAYIKAIGTGCAHPLARFSVSLAPGAPVRLEQCEDDASEPERWTLEALDPDPDYVAAIAVEGRPRRIVCHTWREMAL